MIFRKTLSFVFFLLFLKLTIYAQQLLPNYQETLSVHLNTNEVFIGEYLHFSVIGKSNLSNGEFLSKIIHFEIIDLDSRVIARSYLQLNNGFGEASLFISSGFESGIYGIRFFTKWMLNTIDQSVPTFQVAIINPLRSYLSRTPTPPSNDSSSVINSIDTNYTFSTRTSASIPWDSLFDSHDIIDYSLSITAINNVYESENTTQFRTAKPEVNRYIPEFRGLILEGQLKIKNDDNSSKIFLYGKENSFVEKIAIDSENNFRAVIPFDIKSNIEVFKPSNTSISWTLPNLPLENQLDVLSINSGKKSVISNRFKQVQIMNAYSERNDWDSLDFSINSQIGLPDKTYLVSDYNSFESIEDFFKEIIVGVKYRKANEKTGAELIIYDNGFKPFAIPPLVLINNEPLIDVSDISKLLIKRVIQIDVFNEEYFINGDNYGGVLNILINSEQPMEVNSREMIPLRLLTNKFRKESFIDSHMPDFRRTLLWKQYHSKIENIDFKTSDVTGIFRITLCGIDKTGTWINTSRYIMVTPND